MHRQGGVLNVAQAARHGIENRQLRGMLRRAEVVRLREGIYADGQSWANANEVTRHRIAVAAALLVRAPAGSDAFPADLVGGYRSAGFVWGLPAPRGLRLPDLARPEAPTPAHALTEMPVASAPRGIHLVSGDRRRRTYRGGVEVRPAALPPGHVTLIDNVPFTSLARTTVDLLRHCPGGDALIVADTALRLGLSPDELLVTVADCRGWKGGVLASEVAQIASALAESPAESLARWVCHEQGLPAPELQVEIHDERGFVGRVDLYFRTHRTVLEVDGRIKYSDPYGDATQTLWREKQREDRIRDAGFEVVRTTWWELVSNPQRLRARLLAAFARSQRSTG